VVADEQATLIVTPPSLLKQWVAEMATHAPSLRVCVYTGWKGLLESVMKRTNKDRKSKEFKDVAKRKRDNDMARARNVKKYQRGNVGARVKVESDHEDDDSEDSDSEELGVDEDSLQHRTQKLFVEYVQAHDVVITTYK
jgi:E3 ubiquitin-protein ligase SHPRH